MVGAGGGDGLENHIYPATPRNAAAMDPDVDVLNLGDLGWGFEYNDQNRRLIKRSCVMYAPEY